MTATDNDPVTVLYHITPEDTAALVGFVLTGVSIAAILLDDDLTPEKSKYIERVNAWLRRRKRPAISVGVGPLPSNAISLIPFLKKWGWGDLECQAALYMADL